MSVAILAISLAMQLMAAVLAVRLIRVTRQRLAWGLVSAAVVLMCARRLVTLLSVLYGSGHPLDPEAEGIALVISLLMASGMLMIAPVIGGLRRAEDAALTSAAAYQHLYDNALDLHVLFDLATNRIIDCNPAALRLLGYSREEVVGRSFLGLCADGPANLETLLHQLGDEGEVRDAECQLRRQDGRTLPVSASMSVVRDARGRVLRGHAVLRDISERQEMEEALKASEERYRTLFENAPVGIGVADAATGRLITYNDAMLSQGGYAREDVTKIPSVAALYVDEADRERVLDKLRRGDRVVAEEIRFRAKDGQPYDVSLSLVPIELQGRPCVMAIAEHISHRKQAEAALRATLEQQELILANIDEVVYAFTLSPGGLAEETRLTFVSSHVRAVLGHEPWEFITDPDLWRRLVHPGDLNVIQESLVHMVSSHQPQNREYRIRRDSDGVYRWIADHVTPRIGEGGNVIGAFGVARDVTEEKQAAVDLQRSHEQLRRLAARIQAVREEERTLIAREMHDELGQALTAVKLDLSWLMGALPPGDATALERGRALIGLVDSGINVVRDLAMRLRPAMLDDLGLSAAVEWQAEETERRTEIAIAVRSAIDDRRLDREQATALFRILQESLTNVVRHAGASRVSVDLAFADGGVLLEVTDDGRGIGDHEIWSARSLGLLGIRERAAALGGEVQVTRREEGGTRVRAWVPSSGEEGADEKSPRDVSAAP